MNVHRLIRWLLRSRPPPEVMMSTACVGPECKHDHDERELAELQAVEARMDALEAVLRRFENKQDKQQ